MDKDTNSEADEIEVGTRCSLTRSTEDGVLRSLS